MKRHRGYMALDPKGLEILGATFKQACEGVEAEHQPADEKDLSALRLRIAKLVLELSWDGQLSPDQVIATAVRIIREESEPVA